jgi:hypothetical protein
MLRPKILGAVFMNDVTSQLLYFYNRHPISRDIILAARHHPGQTASEPRESPTSLEECRKEAIVAEARWIVDARCTSSLL